MSKSEVSWEAARFPKGLIVFFVGMCYTNLKYARRERMMIIWLLTGIWILLGCAEAAHLAILMTSRSLGAYIFFSTAFMLTGILVYVGIGIWIYRKGGVKAKKQRKIELSPYMILFAVLAGSTIVHFVKGYVPDIRDAVYEITLGNVSSGSIMSLHPFTGQAGQASMPMRMQILGLSSLYSAFITISQQSPYMIMCKVVPMAVWALSIWLYGAFARKLFPEDVHKRWLFVSVVALVYIATSGSDGLVGQRLFYAGFSAETIRGALLMPYTLYVCWQRKWLLAVLAVLTEACLVWTTYGVGYCLLIAVCMYLVHLWLDRRCQHAA